MAAVNPQIFREYDIRGIVDRDLTPETVELLGRGLGTLARRAIPARAPVIAVGWDARESSTRFRDAFVRGLNATGVDAFEVGLVPTPLCYFAANTLPVDGSAMITGSHNPPQYNGFKVGLGKSTFHGGEIQELRRLIDTGDFASGRGRREERPILAPYLDFVRENLRLGLRRPRLVIDAGNGVGGLVAAPLFRSLGFDVTGMYLEPDGTFPNHHPDPTVEENMRALQAKVLELEADVGIAYDGDADRVGLVDEKGRILWGDQLMILLSRAVLEEVPHAPIIAEVKCSMTLFADIAKHGGQPIMWKAGHSLIKAKMRETGAELAGEMSGHIFFKNRYFGFDDGIYASARLVELLTHTDAALSELFTDVPKTFSTPELRVDASDEKKFAVVEEVRRRFAGPEYRVVNVDGVRVEFDDGWGLVRASNTQPILVLRFEATTEPRLREIQALVEGAVAEAKRSVGA
jgi:phosphomannomutase / phosphoglucomutase